MKLEGIRALGSILRPIFVKLSSRLSAGVPNLGIILKERANGGRNATDPLAGGMEPNIRQLCILRMRSSSASVMQCLCRKENQGYTRWVGKKASGENLPEDISAAVVQCILQIFKMHSVFFSALIFRSITCLLYPPSPQNNEALARVPLGQVITLKKWTIITG